MPIIEGTGSGTQTVGVPFLLGSGMLGCRETGYKDPEPANQASLLRSFRLRLISYDGTSRPGKRANRPILRLVTLAQDKRANGLTGPRANGHTGQPANRPILRLVTLAQDKRANGLTSPRANGHTGKPANRPTGQRTHGPTGQRANRPTVLEKCLRESMFQEDGRNRRRWPRWLPRPDSILSGAGRYTGAFQSRAHL